MRPSKALTPRRMLSWAGDRLDATRRGQARAVETRAARRHVPSVAILALGMGLQVVLLAGCLSEKDWNAYNAQDGGSSSEQVNACGGVNCGSHGSCQEGACHCNTGYSGSRCDRCAAGYTGYPNCKKSTKCECSDTDPSECTSTSSVKFCSDCKWYTESCSSVCGTNTNGETKTLGCTYNYDKSRNVCFCVPPEKDGIIVTLTNKCAGKTLSVALFDMTTKKGTETSYLSYNKTKQFRLACTKGHRMCYGAWSGENYWGCGEKCAYASSCGCCVTCGTTTIEGFNLTCE